MLMDLPYLLFFLSQDEDLQRHGGIDGKHFAGPSSMLPRGPNEFNGCVLAGWKDTREEVSLPGCRRK